MKIQDHLGNDRELIVHAGDSFLPPPEKGSIGMPNGHYLYWHTTEQGREYISTEIGGGVQVWHTALVDPSTLLAAIALEDGFQKLESVIKEAKVKKEAKDASN